ncbi:MAG: SWIM zinc finger family protein, partial [Bacteroidota bacterium]
MSLKLAPDSATADRAKKLSTTRHWRNLARTSEIIWGECKSSGLTYYKVAYHLASQSLKCNCASRKFPCKHAVALANIFSSQPDAFTVAEDIPEWVQDWQAKGTPTNQEITPAQEQARAELRQKNFSKRLDQMVAGLNELENWLMDTLRQGIAALEQQPSAFWQDISARMYDAKLGAIGKRIKRLPLLIGTEEQWPDKVLSELTAFYLLVRGLRKMEELPLNIQRDLLTHAGVNTRKEELFQYGQAVKDTWMILGVMEGVEDNLNYRRTWVLGHETKRYG